MMKQKLILISGIIFLISLFSINFIFADNLGCCFDSSIGTCSPNTYSSDCSGEDAYWSEDATCQSSSHCTEGCCILGTSTGYMTSRLCELEAESRGFDFDWRQMSEQECAEQGNSLDKGACLYIGEYENDCVFTTSSQCNTNEFNPGMLCTAEELNTKCERTEKTTLVEGKEGIYYLDSCGNIANIYDSSKYNNEDYWTYVVSEEDSCGYEERIANSKTCGNCNFEYGSIGRERENFAEYGNYYCADLDCGVVDGKERKNGDSWCVTDAGGQFNEISGDVPLFTQGVNENGESVPVPDVTKIEYTTDTGYKLEWKGYAKQDTWKHGVITEPDGTQRGVDINNLMRKKQGTKTQPGEVICSGDHGDKIKVTMPQGAEKAGGTYEMYSDGWSPGLDRGVTAYYKSPEFGMTGEIESVRTEIESYVPNSPNVGTRYMKKFCLNGEVHNEPCDDFRMETCESDEQGNAQCVNNPWRECLSVSSTSKNNEKNKEEIKENCDSEYCNLMKMPATSGSVKCNTEDEGNEDSDNPSQEIVDELDLSMCVPKIVGGFDFWPEKGSFSTNEESICSMGNYEEEIHFHKTDRRWYHYHEDTTKKYGNLGLLIPPKEGWDALIDVEDLDSYIYHPDYAEDDDSIFYDSPEYIGDPPKYRIPINPDIIGFLNSRCQAISDCKGKENWKGVKTSSGEAQAYATKMSKSEDEDLYYSFSYECVPFSAPSGSSDCQECQNSEEETGIPCSEYRCKSLGKNCEYNPQGGKGYCTESSDNSPPVIGHSKNPSGEVPPYEPIEITITTDETSHCKFNMGDSGGTYEEMDYNVDSNWSTKHKVRLNLPGQRPQEDGFNEYGLIQEDGNYEMYVRCSDVAGNWNIESHLVSFNVMDTPDENPPYIMEFNPKSRSPILYNTTEKEIEFKLNEPAECFWDFEDKEFNSMDYQFDCDEDISDEGSLEGYFCSGVLFNITENTDEQTEYFIRCKDQPWLENNNPDPDYYSRNANRRSEKYLLTASEEFKIKSFSPLNEIVVGPQDTSVNLVVETSGGSHNGKSECKWRILESPDKESNYTSLYHDFSKTNSSVHEQLLTNRSEGKYEIQVRCIDEAGNMKEEKYQFKLNIDDEPPEITRMFKSGDNLKILTSEIAKCYFDYWTCNFDISNKTSISTGYSKEHSVEWNSELKFNLKCLDIWNNQKGGCTEIIKPGIF